MKSHCDRGDQTAGVIRTARAIACAAAVALSFAVATSGAAFAQSGGGLPNTTIAPDDESAPPAPPGAASVNEGTGAEAGGEEAAPPRSAARPAHERRHRIVKHRAVHRVEHHAEPPDHTVVEPANAKLKLKEDAWAYSRPSNSSKTVERVQAGKFLDVTGVTHYYLQARLKSGTKAYIPISAVDLVRPTDKIFRLSSDAEVLSQPSRYGQRLSKVHRGHDVHVVATSLNYLKIRMKSGLEGFIPMSAVE